MRDRIMNRLRISIEPYTHTYYRENGQFCTFYQGSTTHTNGKYSRMIDAGTKKTDEIRTRYLEHNQCEIQMHSTARTIVFDSGLCGANAVCQTTGTDTPGYYPILDYGLYEVDRSETDLALLEAFRFFESGCAPKETLLANFAWELPDVRSLWPTFKNLFKHKDKSSFLKKIPDSKDVSSTYLAYQFGVAPLIGDLIKIWERLSTLNDHIEWLKKNSGQMTKVEFRRSMRQINANPNLPSYPASTPYGYYRKIETLRAGFKAWAILTYDVSQLTELQLKIRTCLRSFGLNNPAAIVWEWLPYSFVVDWILNVGKIIGSLEIPIKLPCVFHDCGHAVWVESKFVEGWSGDGHISPIRTITARTYSRRPGLPLSISSLSLETPSAKQLVLGLALINQKS